MVTRAEGVDVCLAHELCEVLFAAIEATIAADDILTSPATVGKLVPSKDQQHAGALARRLATSLPGLRAQAGSRFSIPRETLDDLFAIIECHRERLHGEVSRVAGHPEARIATHDMTLGHLAAIEVILWQAISARGPWRMMKLSGLTH